MNLNDILRMYGDAHSQPPGMAAEHFDQVAASAPREEVSGALAHAFRSDATPPFGEMVADLFRNSAPAQRAGVLNQILGALGGAGAAGGILGNVLGRLGGGQVSASDAANVTPEQVEEIATRAERHNPSVIDRVSDFYAQHPTLVQALGSVALATALRHMAGRRAA